LLRLTTESSDVSFVNARQRLVQSDSENEQCRRLLSRYIGASALDNYLSNFFATYLSELNLLS